MTQQSDLKPNDIAIILRPTVVDGVWQGDFEVLVSGFGPFTLQKEAIDDMIGMAVLVASTVPFMEEHEEIAQQIMEYCGKYYGEIGDIPYDSNHNSFGDSFILTADTVTQGGKH